MPQPICLHDGGNYDVQAFMALDPQTKYPRLVAFRITCKDCGAIGRFGGLPVSTPNDLFASTDPTLSIANIPIFFTASKEEKKIVVPKLDLDSLDRQYPRSGRG